MNLASIFKAVRAYDSAEWEIFIREWQKGLSSYLEVKRLGGSGDHGRDVIGLCDSSGCGGVWDNYQCKHYEKPLDTPTAVRDAGKIIYFSFSGVFKPPRRSVFVAPRGVTTELRDLLLNPAKFGKEVVDTWDKRIAKNLVAGQNFILKDGLELYVRDFDFSCFGFATLDEVLDDHRKTAYWGSRFGGLIPPPPLGSAPKTIGANESIYVGKLLEVYSEEARCAISSPTALEEHPSWADDLQKHRVRFYDAEAFVAHYRDQTEPGTVEDFAEQVFDAVEPAMSSEVRAHKRLTTAMAAATSAQPASVLAPQAKIRVKQGVCHQLANKHRLSWKK